MTDNLTIQKTFRKKLGYFYEIFMARMWLLSTKELLWAVVGVKWSACSPSTPTIQVRLLLKPIAFFKKLKSSMIWAYIFTTLVTLAWKIVCWRVLSNFGQSFCEILCCRKRPQPTNQPTSQGHFQGYYCFEDLLQKTFLKQSRKTCRASVA